MRVGIVAEYTIGYNFSGMYLQLLRVLEAVQREGIDTSLFDMWHCKAAKYQLLHLFGINYSLSQIVSVISSIGIPYIVSPNHWPDGNWLIHRLLARIDTPRHVLVSRRALERQVLSGARIIIANSSAEARRLMLAYGIPGVRFRVISNGVDPQFRDGDPDIFRRSFGIHGPFVLAVGQFGQPVKNHLRLLQAWDESMPTLVLVGSLAPGIYADRCRELASKLGNVMWVGPVAHHSELLRSAYKACSAFVLPSLYETTGLSALEAAVAGAPVVITNRGATTEYFGDRAVYCDPFKPRSIREAVKRALAAGRDEKRGEYFASKFSWEAVGRMMAEVYQSLIE